MSHLLVIDFDFFFPNPAEAGEATADTSLYDWGHFESPLMLSNALWSTRAAEFLRRGMPLPGVQMPEGGWQSFWARFRFSDDAEVEFGDSNIHAGDLRPPSGEGAFTSITLFDAHHDSGYNVPSVDAWLERGSWSCEDWMLLQQERGCDDLTVRYPRWKPKGVQEPLPRGSRTIQTVDDGSPLETVFDTVMVCRSGAWVPPWCDGQFMALIDACPLLGWQYDAEDLDRGFTDASARSLADQINAVVEGTSAAAPPV